jgi:hypothetical protein
MELPLDQLGAQAKAHILKGDAAKEKAEQHYMSAGLYLKEAHQRIKNIKGLTWDGWLRENVAIGKSRSYELIAIADGRKTVEEIREGYAKANAKRGSSSVHVHGQPSKKTQRNQCPPPVKDETPPWEDHVEQARQAGDDILARVIAKVKALSPHDLETLEKYLSIQFGDD